MTIETLIRLIKASNDAHDVAELVNFVDDNECDAKAYVSDLHDRKFNQEQNSLWVVRDRDREVVFVIVDNGGYTGLYEPDNWVLEAEEYAVEHDWNIRECPDDYDGDDYREWELYRELKGF